MSLRCHILGHKWHGWVKDLSGMWTSTCTRNGCYYYRVANYGKRPDYKNIKVRFFA